MKKIWTVVGTRPEIIRLGPTIKIFDKFFDHKLVHTGQNFGFSMSDVFFRDLDIREPDEFLDCTGNSTAEIIGQIFTKFGKLVESETPDGIVFLGDTNSALVSIIARRLGIATYHLEAGNRSFDNRVPEEVNRKIIDHTCDFNIAYNSYSLRNLLAEGLEPKRSFISGSPMKEVLNQLSPKIESSQVLEELSLSSGEYLVGSFHRQENVDDPQRLKQVIDLIEQTTEHFGVNMVIPLHPRTRSMLDKHNLEIPTRAKAIDPLGIVDYLHLQKNSLAVLSDSGTLAEEASLMEFIGISTRESTERQEALDKGFFGLSGLSAENAISLIETFKERNFGSALPEGYETENFSQRILNIVLSTVDRRDHVMGQTQPNLAF